MPSAVAADTAPFEDRFAAGLRGFGVIGLIAITVILAGNLIVAPLSAVLVLVWVRWSRTPWRDIGYVRPKSWFVEIAAGIASGCAFKLLMKAVVMPLLGAAPVNQPYHFLAHNPAAIPATLFALIVGAGFGEETLFRGFLFERLGRLFGPSRFAKIAIVLLTSARFGLAHYPGQGLAGAEQGAIVGLAFGTFFAIKRRIWILMIAHAAFDVTAYALIYWDVERVVAGAVWGQKL
jgi:membrane protease YdiL (CAAX protease family)